MDTIWDKLIDILIYSIFIGALVGFITYRRLNKELRFIFFYLLISSVFAVIMSYTSANKINNTLFYNLFVFLEFSILLYSIWLNSHFWFYKWAGIIGSTIILTFFIITIIEKQEIYNNTLKLVETSLLIITSIVYLIRIFGESFLKYVKDPFKYVIVGIFTYFSCSILILTVGNQPQLFNLEQFGIMFFIHAAFYSIMVLLMTISFIKCYRK